MQNAYLAIEFCSFRLICPFFFIPIVLERQLEYTYSEGDLSEYSLLGAFKVPCATIGCKK